MTKTTIFAKLALLPGGWCKDVRVTIDANGMIARVVSGVSPGDDDIILVDQAIIPALGNIHSHVFQRVMAGFGETRRFENESFWSWRTIMYQIANLITPEQLEAIAALAFMEMLEAGFASVGEFHYIHHQKGGHPYDNQTEMALKIIASAKDTGIGLTLLPVAYSYGGAGKQPLSAEQKRFGNSVESFLRLFEDTQSALSQYSTKDSTIGVAPHSLRATSPRELKQLVSGQRLVHIHIAEQTAEVDQIEAWLGMRPIKWLLANLKIDDKWCLIHSTQTTPGELRSMAASNAVAGLCPVTEANLADGIFNLSQFQEFGGQIAIGTDSNIAISAKSELKMLEYSQRLLTQKRCVAVGPWPSVGRNLLEATLRGGAQGLDRLTGGICPGKWGDMLTLDLSKFNWYSDQPDNIIDQWVFTNTPRAIVHLWAAGRLVVRDGRHINHEQIQANYRQVVSELASGIKHQG